MSVLLQVEELSKSFGGLHAVQDVSFTVGRDEVVGIIGPNGSGKTTLMRLIIGMLKADGGKIVFKGENIFGRQPWDIVKKGIAMTHQVVRPFRELPIIANVMLGVIGSGRRRGEWIKRVETVAMDALEFCGISDLARESASILPHGDLKRLEVARALATEPEPYLAIVTLAVPVILQGVVFLFPDVTGGELGLFSLSPISESQTFVYYFCLVVMLVCVGIMWKVTDTKSRMIRTGIIFCALREDEISARTSGINTVRYKILAFALSGFFAGISGGLYAHTMKVVGPSTLEFLFSIYPLIWTVFGGSWTIYGPVVGAYLLYFLSMQLLAVFPEIRMTIFTAIIIGMILFMPEGIIRWLRDKIEIRCPRCKVINSVRRQSCRVCEAPLHGGTDYGTERKKEISF